MLSSRNDVKKSIVLVLDDESFDIIGVICSAAERLVYVCFADVVVESGVECPADSTNQFAGSVDGFGAVCAVGVS